MLAGLVATASVDLSKLLGSFEVLRSGAPPQLSSCVLRNIKSEGVSVELFRTVDVVEKMVEEMRIEPTDICYSPGEENFFPKTGKRILDVAHKPL